MLKRLTRLLRHRWVDDARHTIPKAAMQRISQHVVQSEARHTGEIRICIESGLPSGALLSPLDTPTLIRQRAVALFGDLRVWDTECNNGVLVYLLVAERAIELVADRGINHYVTPAQWQSLVQRLGNTLRQNRWEDGLTQTIDDITVMLEQHFPASNGTANPNELPDTPIIV